MPIRAIISDVGGVLVRFDTRKHHKAVAEALGTRPEIFKEWWDTAEDGSEPRWRPWCRGEWSVQKLLGLFAERFGRGFNPDELERIWVAGFEGVITETVDLLSAVRRRYHIPIISCTDVDHFFGALNRRPGEPFHEFFDAEVQSWRLGVLKPHRRMYEEAVRHAGVSAGECLFIDDLLVNVEGARHVGLRAFQFTNHEQLAADFARCELLP